MSANSLRVIKLTKKIYVTPESFPFLRDQFALITQTKVALK